MSRPVFIVGGPNLGRLGRREPEIYGDLTWEELGRKCKQWGRDLALDVEFLQSDHEGDLVQMIHRATDEGRGLILNAAAYTHTSVAVRDAVAACDVPVIELHLTNPAAREEFRRNNLLCDVVTATVNGFGVDGYRLALTGLKGLLDRG